MKSKIIIMLTHHDQTVADAKDVFNTVKDMPVECWGFKDVGLPRPQMQELIDTIRAAGKTTFLEVVSYSREACMAGAKLAVEMGFDYLMGTLFCPEVWAFLADKPIQYLPFVGKVYGSPSILEGTAEEMIEQGKELMAEGIPGFDLLAYRHKTAPETLIREFVPAIPGRVVIAGSIASRERMAIVEESGAWGFTMGSALFNKDFIPEGGFRENLECVLKIMDTVG